MNSSQNTCMACKESDNLKITKILRRLQDTYSEEMQDSDMFAFGCKANRSKYATQKTNLTFIIFRKHSQSFLSSA